MNQLLTYWLEDVLNDDVVVSKENPKEELKNTWAFTIPLDSGITLEDMLNFMEKIVNYRKKQALDQMIIYSWYDEMSGQFKFSLTSLPKEMLPFRCELEHVDSLKEILALCLNTSEPGFIPKKELEEISLDEAFQSEDQKKLYKLKVWSTVINE